MSASKITHYLRKWQRKSAKLSRLPFISVIVPVRNEEKYLERLLGQLLDQHYDANSFEVIVADGRSTDQTRSIVVRLQAQHQNLHLLDNPKRLSSAGRNRAVEAARGDHVLLIDGHSEIENRNYLRDLAETFLKSGADCVGRPQPLDVPGASALQCAIATARASRFGHHPDSFIYSSEERFVPPQSVAVAYRRGVFDAVGMFDESFDACEDVEFNHRVDQAGFQCFFTPKVAVRYQPRSTLTGLFKQMMRYGQGRVRLYRKHPETFSWKSFLPGFCALSASLAPLAALLSPWLALIAGAGLGLYALAVLLTSFTIVCRKRTPKLLPWLLLVFPAIHFGAGFGILKEWARGGKRSRLLTGRIPHRIGERTALSTARTE